MLRQQRTSAREYGNLVSRVWACPFMSLLTPKWIQMAKWPRVLHVQTGNLDQMWSSGKISEQEVPSHGFASPEFNPVSSCRGRAKESGTQKHGGSAGYGFSWRFHTFSKETTSGLKDPDWRCIQDVSLWPPLFNFPYLSSCSWRHRGSILPSATARAGMGRECWARWC